MPTFCRYKKSEGLAYIEGLRIAAIAPNEGPDRVRYFLSDQVDSVKLVTDEKGKVVSRFEYYPYGESFVEENYQEEEAIAPKFGSQELDKESGYYYFNARHYNPEISRFVSADPVIDGVEDTQGWNRYSYVKGNPVVYKDPTGNISVSADPHAPAHFSGQSQESYNESMAEYENSQEFKDRTAQANLKKKIAQSQKEKAVGGANKATKAAASAALDFVPGLGNAKATQEVVTGKDIITGEKLSTYDRAVSGLGVLIGGLGKLIGKGIKSAVRALGFGKKAGELEKRLSRKTKALKLKRQNNGRNRVTLRSEKNQYEIDLDGKAHNNIETPHTKKSPRNLKAPNQPAYNTKKAPTKPTTDKELRMVRKYRNRQTPPALANHGFPVFWLAWKTKLSTTRPGWA